MKPNFSLPSKLFCFFAMFFLLFSGKGLFASLPNKLENSQEKLLDLKAENGLENKPTNKVGNEKLTPLSMINPFSFANILGEAVAKSGAEAKVIATNNARKQALAELFLRLKLEPKLVEKFNNEELSSLIYEEKITNEKISSNSYKGNFSMTFSQKFVIHFIKKKNLTNKANIDNSQNQNISQNKADYSTKKQLDSKDLAKLSNQEKIILLPIIKKVNNYTIWEDKNIFREAIANYLQGKKLGNFNQLKLLKNDQENVAAINENNIESITFKDIESALIKEKSSEIYFLILTIDEIENKAKITLKNYAKKPKQPLILSFSNVDYLGYEDLVKKLSTKTIDYIANNSDIFDNNNEKEKITLEIKVSNFDEWIIIHQKLLNSGLVADINLKSINKNNTIILAKYLGNKVKIIEELKQSGFLARKKEDVAEYFIIELANSLQEDSSQNNDFITKIINE